VCQKYRIKNWKIFVSGEIEMEEIRRGSGKGNFVNTTGYDS